MLLQNKFKIHFFYWILIYTGLFGCKTQNNFKNPDCTDFNLQSSKKLELLQNKDTSTFMNWISLIIKNDSTCIDARLTRADIYFNMGQLHSAKKDYISVILLDSLNTYSLYQLGILYHIKNMEDSACHFLNRALNTKRLKKNGDFIIDYHTINEGLSTKASKYDIPYNEIIYQLGISYYYKRQSDAAFRCFNFCITSNYKVSDALIYRGAIYYEEHELKLACRDFQKSKALNNSKAQFYIDKYCKKTKNNVTN